MAMLRLNIVKGPVANLRKVNKLPNLLPSSRPPRNKLMLGAVGASVAAGTVLVLGVLASGVFGIAVIKDGSLSGGATIVSDNNATGGRAVKFGTSSPTPTPAPTPSPTPSPGYSVTGNTIKNSSGQQVLLHGVDRPSLEWSCSGQAVTGGGSGIPQSDFSTMRSGWNANAVRIAVSEDRWLPGTKDTCTGYQNTVETAVSQVQAQGMIAIIDLHWSDQGNSATTSGQQCMPDQNSILFWQQVAAIYKNNPGVWFELYNEPYPPGSSYPAKWNTWQNGGTVSCTAAVGGGQGTWNAPGMQALVNAVRGTGATNIAIAGGVDWSSNLSSAPVLSGGNIAYAIHIYRQSAGATWGTSGWDYQFGTTAARVPVVATEFGDQGCDGSNFDQSLLNYFHSHNTGYTAWAWFSASCSFTSIIADAAGNCYGATSGCVIQADMKKQP